MRSIGISAFYRSSATYARQWLYDHKILVAREQDLRAMVLAAIRQFEASLGRTIQADVGREAVQRWRDKLVAPHQSITDDTELVVGTTGEAFNTANR